MWTFLLPAYAFIIIYLMYTYNYVYISRLHTVYLIPYPLISTPHIGDERAYRAAEQDRRG